MDMDFFPLNIMNWRLLWILLFNIVWITFVLWYFSFFCAVKNRQPCTKNIKLNSSSLWNYFNVQTWLLKVQLDIEIMDIVNRKMANNWIKLLAFPINCINNKYQKKLSILMFKQLFSLFWKLWSCLFKVLNILKFLTCFLFKTRWNCLS